jgi:D-sedoheptulose 7-phosphate isomerase
MSGQLPGRAHLPGQAHVDRLRTALAAVEDQLDTVTRWGRSLADVLPCGGRLLVAGNGGSAAQAQHFTAEIVGRYRDERCGFSAVALHAETSTLTAILNDYGPAEVYARQVAAHGRAGDICALMSTSGRSPNLVAAARRARERGLTTWAMTGPLPNPLAAACDDVLAIDVAHTATVQEAHLVVVHLVCADLDEQLKRRGDADRFGFAVPMPDAVMPR